MTNDSYVFLAPVPTLLALASVDPELPVMRLSGEAYRWEGVDSGRNPWQLVAEGPEGFKVEQAQQYRLRVSVNCDSDGRPTTPARILEEVRKHAFKDLPIDILDFRAKIHSPALEENRFVLEKSPTGKGAFKAWIAGDERLPNQDLIDILDNLKAQVMERLPPEQAHDLITRFKPTFLELNPKRTIPNPDVVESFERMFAYARKHTWLFLALRSKRHYTFFTTEAHRAA